MIILKNNGIVEKKRPLINIITRTSNRPNFFEANRASISSQTYPSIRHIVGYDDIESESYLNGYPDVEKFYIPSDYADKSIDIPDPMTGGRFKYNLYFNFLFNKVEDGWILILDDDDHLANNKVVAHMASHLKYKTDMLIFQMQYKNGNVLPAKLYKKPVIGKIGSPCILIHSSIAKRIKWDGWKCADYRYISKCWDYSERKIWLNTPLINIGSTIGNFGARNDANSENTPSYGITVSKRDKIAAQLRPLVNRFKYDGSYYIHDIDVTYNLLIENLKNGKNFTYLRFGDNDFFHLTGASKSMGALGNNKTTYSSELQHYLQKSFSINSPNYIKTYNFGGKSTHHSKFGNKPPKLNDSILSMVKNNDNTNRFHHVLFFYIILHYYPQYTKNIFSFIKKDNATLYVGSVHKPIAEKVVGEIKAHIKTPKTNATTDIQSYINTIDRLLASSYYKYIILACGQLSRVLGGYIFEKYNNSYTVIDIGGVIETYNKNTNKRSILENGYFYRKSLKMKHKPVYVSMSLLPSRIEGAIETITSLLNQSMLPDKIELYIPKNCEKDPLPENFKLPEAYKHSLIEVYYVDDIGPISKLLFSLEKHLREDVYIITVDDDVKYPVDMVYGLVKNADENPQSAFAYRGRVINNGVTNYNMTALYKSNEIKKIKEVDIITGTWGALYYPVFFKRDFFDAKNFKKTNSLFYTDDIWISGHLKKNGIKMNVVPNSNEFKKSPMHNIKSLWEVNKDGANNNSSLRILNFFEK